MKSLRGNRTRPLVAAEGPFRIPSPRRWARRKAAPGGTGGGFRDNALRRRVGVGPSGQRRWWARCFGGVSLRGLTGPHTDVKADRGTRASPPAGGRANAAMPAGWRGFPSSREAGAPIRLGAWRGPSPFRRRREGPVRPVLKHGPRSLTCTRVLGRETRGRSESETGERGGEILSASPAGPPQGGSSRSVHDGTRKMVN